jgi:hypothetical protein
VALKDLVVGVEVVSIQLQKLLVRFERFVILSQVEIQLPLQLIELKLVKHLCFVGLKDFQGRLKFIYHHVTADFE